MAQKVKNILGKRHKIHHGVRDAFLALAKSIHGMQLPSDDSRDARGM